uniref:Matrix-remodeling-associated protein 7 helical domain-containing protein n=1 Tax=Glossina brevipalpis TaxID=37001 RepID=A0A1A9WSQ9_9MUSC
MYKYSGSIFDGIIPDMYVITMATAFLAVIVAFHCNNFLKNENKKRSKDVLGQERPDVNLENLIDDDDDNNRTTVASETLKYEIQRRLNAQNKNIAADEGETPRNYSYTDSEDDEERPVLNVDGLVGKLKSRRLKKMEAKLTIDQLTEERRIEREQLAAIFELLKKQEAELNMKEIDEHELNAQLSLYR